MNGFKYAWAGLKTAFSSEINVRTHLVATLVVCVAGWYFHITTIEWLVVIVNIGLVISMELLNTAVEYLVDFISPEIHPLAGKIKDISAAAVLVTAVTACLTGLIIFLPKMYQQFN